LSFKFKKYYCLENLVIAFEISDTSQYMMCRVLGLASRVELLRDVYCNKSENELSNLDQVSEDDPDTDWLEPSLFPYNPKLLQANGSDRVYYAIHLLQTDPSVQVHSMLYDSIFILSVYKKINLINFSSYIFGMY
jgi:hypothetical protein